MLPKPSHFECQQQPLENDWRIKGAFQRKAGRLKKLPRVINQAFTTQSSYYGLYYRFSTLVPPFLPVSPMHLAAAAAAALVLIAIDKSKFT